MYRIKPNVTALCNGKFRISNVIADNSSSRPLWFEVEAAYQDMIATDAMDAAVVSCLLPAMRSGQDIIVEGVMSSKLYYNLTHYLIPILREFFPHFHVVAIKPAAVHGLDGPRGNGVMAGFSGGIDSFCNYYDHSGERAPEDFRITHCVYNNVGSHGQNAWEQDDAICAKRFAALHEFPKREGHPFIKVNSNLDEIISMDFELTHTIRNAAVALLMQKRICKFLYASAFHVRETKIRLNRSIAYFEPVVLPLLGTERLDCIASGGQYTRVGKTELVSGMKDIARFLDVCVNPPHTGQRVNCSRCWKCLRTELTLSIIGRLDAFAVAFDIEWYRRYEKLYLMEVLSSDDPLCREIAEWIRVHNVKTPRMVRVLAVILPAVITGNVSGRIIPALARRNKWITSCINACLSA